MNSNDTIKEFNNNAYLGLMDVTRFSGIHLILPDSDASHTMRVQLYILKFYDILEEHYPSRWRESCISAVYKALTHDLDEAVMCDIPRPVKYYDKEMLQSINRVAGALMKEHFSEPRVKDIQSSKDYTFEGFVVAFFDIYDAIQTLAIEYSLQNTVTLYEKVQESCGFLKAKLLDIEDYDVPKEFIGFFVALFNDFYSKHLAFDRNEYM